MARIRSIKPDFFQSEDVVALSYRARITWIGLWTHVDDEGRCKDSARLIKGQIWPLEDDVTAKHVEADLVELERSRKLLRYEVAGELLIQILNWHKHQRVSRPTPSKLPSPQCALTESSVSNHGDLTEEKGAKPRNDAEVAPSVNPHGALSESSMPEGDMEVEVEREEEGEAKKAPHLFPADFSLTPDREAWAKQNAPGVNANLQTDNFIDYWKNGDGARKKKSNWEATWRNWMRTKQGDAETRGWKPPQERAKDIFNPGNW